MHILLFGKNGQVGWELQRALAPLGHITAVDFDSADYCGDFSNPAGVAETVRLVKPDVIVNAAAHTAVDKAESEREFAELLNATCVLAGSFLMWRSIFDQVHPLTANEWVVF